MIREEISQRHKDTKDTKITKKRIGGFCSLAYRETIKISFHTTTSKFFYVFRIKRKNQRKKENLSYNNFVIFVIFVPLCEI